MGKVLKILGIILIVIILGVGGCAGYLYYEQTKYSEEVVSYINENFPKLANWKTEEFKTYMVSEVIEKTSDEQLNKLLNSFKKLGKYKSMQAPKFVNIFKGADTILTYSFKASFESGEANITMRLIPNVDGFKIFHFHLDSPALFDN